ncbi:MAG: hypothetical protein U1E45_06585 [Geminicoccaceae bacterium]
MIPRRGALGLLGGALVPFPAADPAATVGALFDGTPESVGRRHLSAHPDHAREAAAMAHDLVGAAAGRQALRAMVGDLIRDDFASGRIVLVDGWVLSVTEARGCACRVLAG